MALNSEVFPLLGLPTSATCTCFVHWRTTSSMESHSVVPSDTTPVFQLSASRSVITTTMWASLRRSDTL